MGCAVIGTVVEVIETETEGTSFQGNDSGWNKPLASKVVGGAALDSEGRLEVADVEAKEK